MSFFQDYNGIYQNAKKNAAKRGIPFDLTRSEFDEIVTKSKGHCRVTGLKFNNEQPNGIGTIRPYAASLDRIDSAQGYSKANCRLVCVVVNFAMSTFGDKPLFKMLDALQNKRIAAARDKVDRYEANVLRDIQTFKDQAILSQFPDATYLPIFWFRYHFRLDYLHSGSLQWACKKLAEKHDVPLRTMTVPLSNYTNLDSSHVSIRWALAYPLWLLKQAATELNREVQHGRLRARPSWR
jgi:hypothetical protein